MNAERRYEVKAERSLRTGKWGFHARIGNDWKSSPRVYKNERNALAAGHKALTEWRILRGELTS